MDKNCAKALKRPANTEGRDKTPFTEVELLAIYNACDELVTRGTYGKENRARVKAFVYILRYTGLRISDATKLDDTRMRGDALHGSRAPGDLQRLRRTRDAGNVREGESGAGKSVRVHPPLHRPPDLRCDEARRHEDEG